ncbi:MarR family transcriptional regulator [Halorubrum distributum]|uniref:MarR family transcriptional regulator n=1 Tax=Halorubrum distributum TaxID=29283 RepID=UPI00126808F3|nr:MarR family transcriptional regulator [Halorubrum arcis]
MGESSNDTPFPVLPDTDEHTILSFLVRNSGESFTSRNIAEQTSVRESDISETMENLLEHQLICHSKNTYYVDPERETELKHRLESIDAVVRLFENAPDDDVYSEEGWEDQVESIL